MMTIRKGIKALIPSVQYGNVTFEAELTHSFDVPTDIKELAQKVRTQGNIIDKLLEKEYTTFKSVFSDGDTDRLTTI